MTKQGFMPGAIDEEITPGANDPEIVPCGVIYHVAVSRSDDIRGVFTDGRGIESHFYVAFDGTIRQYRSIFREADAQFAGNSFMARGHRVGFLSIETEGMGPGKWTPSQIAALKRITLWAQSQSGVPHVFRPFPLKPCDTWASRGVGYHSMFAEWNTNSHSCPGPARIEQFHKILVPWMSVERSRKATPSSRGENLDEAIHDLKVADKRQPKHRSLIRQALDALRKIKPFTH